MKKVLLMVLAVLFCFVITGCGGKADNKTATPKVSESKKVIIFSSAEEYKNEFYSKCILRSVTDVDAFQSGRFAKQNGRPETQIFLLTLSV